jgi:hypothetical protein
VSSWGRYRREQDEELMATYQLDSIEEVKVVLGGYAWRCALWREKRVSAMVAGVEGNGGAMSCDQQRGDNVGAYWWRQRR